MSNVSDGYGVMWHSVADMSCQGHLVPWYLLCYVAIYVCLYIFIFVAIYVAILIFTDMVSCSRVSQTVLARGQLDGTCSHDIYYATTHSLRAMSYRHILAWYILCHAFCHVGWYFLDGTWSHDDMSCFESLPYWYFLPHCPAAATLPTYYRHIGKCLHINGSARSAHSARSAIGHFDKVSAGEQGLVPWKISPMPLTEPGSFCRRFQCRNLVF